MQAWKLAALPGALGGELVGGDGGVVGRLQGGVEHAAAVLSSLAHQEVPRPEDVVHVDLHTHACSGAAAQPAFPTATRP